MMSNAVKSFDIPAGQPAGTFYIIILMIQQNYFQICI